MIFEYVKDRKNRKVGIFVAIKNSKNKVSIGFSKAKNPYSKTLKSIFNSDKFNLELGKEIAIGRAEKDNIEEIPFSMKQQFIHFVARCRRYFKNIPFSENLVNLIEKNSSKISLIEN